MAALKVGVPRNYLRSVLLGYQSSSGAASLNHLRFCTQGTRKTTTTDSTPPSQSPSSSVKKEEYKVPEYYEHNEYSFVDIEMAMSQYRLPQPSSKVRVKQ